MHKIKEHYVPQFYLNNFTDDDRLLHIYDVKRKKFYTEKSRNVCFIKNLYEAEWKDANPKLGIYILPNNIEDIFCKYEGEFAKLLQTIICVCSEDQNPNALILHGKEKEVLIQFIVNLMLRNPVNMERLRLFEISECMKKSDEFLLYEDILSKMGLGGVESIYLTAQKKVMLTNELDGNYPQVWVNCLQKIYFSFFYAQQGEFITSDIPVCLGNDITISGEDKTCLYFALSPKVAVLFGNYTLQKKRKNRMIKIDKGHIDFFNRQIIKHHNYINILIGNSKESIERYL